ncbi:MAG: IS4 family transposase [Burkholderiales bacterium]
MKIAKKRLQHAVKRFKQGFADRPTRALDELLSSDVVCAIVDEEVGMYRERVYPPLTTLGLFIGQALSADGACQDAVARHLSERTAQGEHQCSLSSGPYCKARSRLPLPLIERLAVSVGERLEDMSCKNWKWRGRLVKLLDGTTVSMPDTQANQAVYPQSGEQQPGLGFPLAMLVALISLSTGAVLRWASGACRGKGSGEQALFRTLMPHLTAGDIILVDRFHCTYFTVAMLAGHGVDILTRQHQRRCTDFRQGQRLGHRDRLVTWIRPQRPDWMDQATYARMPQELTVRQTEVAGRILVTTLTDARSVAPLDLDALYRQRWQVEVDLRSIKAVMGMDILRAKSPAMIDKEIAVHLLAYNLVRGLMARAAAGAEVIARALSFKGALQLLLAFQQHLRWAGRKSVDIMNAHLLGAISAMTLPIRPGRIEPHAIKRRPKNHALLTVPRHVARAAIIRARKAYA